MLKTKIKYFKVLIIIFILTISFLGIIPFVFASPDNTTLYTTADAEVTRVPSDTNYGDGTVFNVKTNTATDARTFLKFDLSGLPTGAVISLATLRAYCYHIENLVAGITDVEARRVADDSWNEVNPDGITWNNQPEYGDIEDTTVPAVGWVEWTVTDFVVAEFADDETVSVCLKSKTENYDASIHRSVYHAKELEQNDPELYIEYSIISDDFPFYSNVGNDGVIQVGEYADFWVFWEDDVALDTCYFSTNNTGSWVNSSLSVSGVSSWANKTLQLNYTSSVRVNYQWFCNDTANQWSNTSIYFLTTTPLYITFNFNNSTMGKFKVDSVNTANETQNSYNYNESILLDGIPLSSDYVFNNFTWIGGNSIINSYYYDTSGNNTVWCYFGIAEIGGIHEDYFVLGFVIAGCAILFMVIVLKGKKKEK